MAPAKFTAIIPARGGSKGLPGKNIRPFCGKPLLAWSIEQARQAEWIDSVWVTSDCPDILSVAERFGARAIQRPSEISGDTASSESAWLHAMDVIEASGHKLNGVVAMQATSPLRESSDLDGAIRLFYEGGYDSVLSGSPLEVFFIWERDRDRNEWRSANYDYRRRPRRQELPPRAHENGSFYLFRPNGFRENNNRLHNRIGLFEMPLWKSFEIDTLEEFELCEVMMKHYLARTP